MGDFLGDGERKKKKGNLRERGDRGL